MASVLVARLHDLPEGRGVERPVGGRLIALFRVGDEVHALDADCPHRRGPLAEGWLVGSCVECPWHGWRFDLVTGVSARNPEMRIAVHTVRIVDQEVWVEVGDRGAGPQAP